MVETSNGGGTYVKKASTSLAFNTLIPFMVLKPRDVQEILEFRRGIESMVAGYAAERATDEDIIELNEIVSHMEQIYQSGDMKLYSESDYSFHQFIARLSKNSLIERVVDIIGDIFQQQISDSNLWLGAKAGHDGHLKIAEAIKKKNPKVSSFLQ